ncbi:manganese efflux pump [Irregularibacter muris]|uniref:Manganese efflux pump n=1 Tax=Irregularibacter muris TaxID=1796619 RepID=A0AAE3HI29_9FIRM|nr:manganese efflux pump [Irregularibacter muris]MCR1898958.1 manganese efflux pump [Irregularibacter muris]
MKIILPALLFSISACLDNVVVGIAYGIKKIKIGISVNIMIACITTLGTFLSMVFGTYISKLFPPFVANLLGGGMIVFLGIYFIVESLVKLERNTPARTMALKDIEDMKNYARKSDADCSGHIDMKESIFVALGLTLNNIGTGIAASITGVNIHITLVATFVLSILTIMLGRGMGNRVLGRFFGKYAPLIAGALLVLLGGIEIAL